MYVGKKNNCEPAIRRKLLCCCCLVGLWIACRIGEPWSRVFLRLFSTVIFVVVVAVLRRWRRQKLARGQQKRTWEKETTIDEELDIKQKTGGERLRWQSLKHDKTFAIAFIIITISFHISPQNTICQPFLWDNFNAFFIFSTYAYYS